MVEQIYSTKKQCHIRLLPNPQFRQYKLQTQDNEWIIIKDTIRSPRDLKKHLVRHQPKNAYQTINCFQNPISLSQKGTARLIKKYLVLDFDNPIKEQVQNAITIMQPKARIIGYNRTSKKGLHLYYELYNNLSEAELTNLQANLKGVCAGTPLQDQNRIVRIIGTYNGNKGVWSYGWTAELQGLPDYERMLRGLSNSPQLVEGLENDNKKSRKGVFDSRTTPDRSRISPKLVLDHYFFVKNHVPRMRDYFIAHFITKKPKTNQLRRISQEYGLGTIYQYYNIITECYETISLIPINKKKLKKILEKTKSKNLNAYKKYHHTWIKISQLVPYQKIVVEREEEESKNLIPQGNLGSSSRRPPPYTIFPAPTNKKNLRVDLTKFKVYKAILS